MRFQDLHPRDLGHGLCLRWGTPEDVDRLATFAVQAFRDTPDEPPYARLATEIRELGSGSHPLTDAQQAVFVEDRAAGGRVVAALWNIPTTWSVGGIVVRVDRPEYVATDHAYRRRGLARALLTALHTRSTRDGSLVQALTGIPYFYRQFGYEHALDLRGGRIVRFRDLPPQQPDVAEPNLLRKAGADDVPFLMALYAQEHQRSLVATVIPAAYWQCMVDPTNYGNGWRALLIVDTAASPTGYVLVRRKRWDAIHDVSSLAVRDGVSLLAVLPPVLRQLREYLLRSPLGHLDTPPDAVMFQLGASHPVYAALGVFVSLKGSHPAAF